MNNPARGVSFTVVRGSILLSLDTCGPRRIEHSPSRRSCGTKRALGDPSSALDRCASALIARWSAPPSTLFARHLALVSVGAAGVAGSGRWQRASSGKTGDTGGPVERYAKGPTGRCAEGTKVRGAASRCEAVAASCAHPRRLSGSWARVLPLTIASVSRTNWRAAATAARGRCAPSPSPEARWRRQS
jgi:hypothetical protein